MFAKSLGVYNTDYYNRSAWPGDKTSDLLDVLSQPQKAYAVAKADILTVTIGGNNLLGPSIAAICGIWGIDPSDQKYAGNLTGQLMLTEIGSMNKTIESYSRMFRYRVVDINQAFKDPEVTDAGLPLTFDIAGAIKTAAEMAYLLSQNPDRNDQDYLMLELQLLQKTDPHPTYFGHVVAYQLLEEVRSCKKPARPVWPKIYINSNYYQNRNICN